MSEEGFDIEMDPVGPIQTGDDPPEDQETLFIEDHETEGLQTETPSWAGSSDGPAEWEQKVISVEEQIKAEEKKRTDTSDEAEKQHIRDTITYLKDEHHVHHYIVDVLRGKLRRQFTAIRETIVKLLDEDTTLAEKLQTVFREQDMTVASMLTALWFFISTVVLAITGGGGITSSYFISTPKPDPSNAKNWITKHLQMFSGMLETLAEKTEAALSCIIDTIVPFLFNTVVNAIRWQARNLVVLDITIVVAFFASLCFHISTSARTGSKH